MCVMWAFQVSGPSEPPQAPSPEARECLEWCWPGALALGGLCGCRPRGAGPAAKMFGSSMLFLLCLRLAKVAPRSREAMGFAGFCGSPFL